jgi:hypothetical protein
VSEVTVVLSVNEVAVTKRVTDLEVVQLVQEVGLTSPGPQGPPGPRGLPGAAGGSVFEFTQSTPAATWIIDHNLGRKVQVTIFDANGQVVYSDVTHGSVNQTTIYFASPVVGSALIS